MRQLVHQLNDRERKRFGKNLQLAWRHDLAFLRRTPHAARRTPH